MNKHLHVSDITYPSASGLHQLLSSVADAHPEKTALIFREEKLTFRELDESSDLVAARLLSLGIEKEDFVAIYLERSLEMIIGIFGILKAGGAYVPIDVDYPKDRMSFMVMDAQAKAILTQSHLQSNLPETSAQVLCLDKNLLKNNEPINKPSLPFSSNQLAYMIYTSGSTGMPKGVMISHENVCNQLEGQHAIAPEPIGAMMLTCSISFDVSVLTIFWTLLQGATLVLPEQGEEKDMAKLSDTTFRNRVTHILTLPSLYTLLLEQGAPDKLQSLKLVNVSGEVCPVSLAQKHEGILSGCQLYNLYGPTEATVNCTYFTFPQGYAESKAPIGIPILNYKIFILDKNLDEVAHGEIGEIYIGGTKPVVGRGYWNRPELTAERFVSISKLETNGSSLYKTGDLGRWMPDGNIEFLGRSDFQVKYRGFRIELGEIETAISNHPSVKETVVVLRNVHEVNNQKLAAYITLNHDHQLSVSEIRNHLAATLPEYMLPSHVVFLDKMPLTTNGKFDRQALPEPAGDRPDLANAYEAPMSGVEQMIAQKWEALLGISPIGRNDKFFELGGTSIQAAKFIGNLMTEFNSSIFITSIFDHPTVATYSQFLEKNYSKNISDFQINLGKLESHEQVGSSSSSHLVLTPSQIASFPEIVPAHLTKESIEASSPNLDLSPIFILAPPRSGTTLLRMMLAGHPGLFACNELQLLHFDTLADRSKAFSGKFQLWSEGLIRAIMELKDISADEAKSFLNYLENKKLTTQQMFAELQRWARNRTIVDKSPSYLLDPLALEKAIHDFPNARFIHLVRHPYSMVKSFEKYHIDQALYLHDHDFSGQELGELVWLWSNKNAVEFLNTIPKHQYFQVNYEDLVKEPKKVMQELCSDLSIEFHPNLLAPYQDLDKKMVDGIYQNSRSMGDTNFEKKANIDSNKANDWKGVLTDDFLSEETKEQAGSFGYKFKNDEPSRNQARQEEEKNGSSKETDHNTDIAIIGMACRFPGANTLDEFWENLVNSKDVSKVVTDAEIAEAGITTSPNHVKRAYSLSEPYAFDASFFGILPKEASLTDPQHRVFLETAYHALESAGYDPYKFEGKIGLFGGVAKNTYFTKNIMTNPQLLEEAGGYKEMLASESSFSITRAAYLLNLQGPAVNVQTACSTGGVGVHLGCQSILSGDSDMVLVGGGRIQPNLDAGYEYVEGEPMSPDGYCRAFDAKAKGMVQGNGMGMLLLKRLDKAMADGDHIWAVIKSTAINNDGAEKTGITAPSSKGQAACIADAIEKAGLNGNQIGYFETHGTGTFIGDPIEIQGLTEAVRRNANPVNIPIGSVKTNIGHMDAGACIAGIIKTALSLYHGVLPPSMHYSTPNPQLGLDKTPFFVNSELQPWLSGKEPRRAGVSSFGLGGTNAHIILEETPNGYLKTNSTSSNPELLLLSAKSANIVKKASDSIVEFMQRNEVDTADAAMTLALDRPQFNYRTAVVYENGKTYQLPVDQKSKPVQTIFMFPGGGSQYERMTQDLYLNNPFFRDQMDYCFKVLLEQHGLDLKKAIFPEMNDEESILKWASYTFPGIFCVEISLAKLWQHWGVQPDQMIGHSMGEYTAACLADVMSVEDALGLVAVRGKLFDSLDVEGGMLSIAASVDQVQPYLGEEHTISVINKKNSIAVSSTLDGIESLEQKLTANDIKCAKLHITVPTHSPFLDPILDEFRKHLQAVDFQEPKLPFVSNVTGTWIEPHQATDPDYWVKHLRQAVLFDDGLQTIINTPDTGSKKRIFLEVGPGQTLSTFARAVPTLQGEERAVLASVRHPKEAINDISFLYKTVGRLWSAGVTFDWEHFFNGKTHNRIPLPNYPFERVQHFVKPGLNQPAPPTQNITKSESSPSQGLSNASIPTMEITTRIPTLIAEIKQLLFELSGVEPSEMQEDLTFLELGFDSLFLSQAVIKINYKFKVKLSFRALFEEAQTIADLAEYLDKEIPADLFRPKVEKPAMQQEAPKIAAEYPPMMPSTEPIQLNSQAGNVEQLIQQQLSIMQQQLNLLRCGEVQNTQNPLYPLSQPTAITNVEMPNTDSESTNEIEIEIKRNAKGVTAKMGNYKKIGVDNELTGQQHKSLLEFIARYNQLTPISKELSQQHRQVYADPRSVTGFSKLWKEICYQIAHEKSKGSKIWDVDGNEYIDYVMSYGVALFGHMPDFVENAVIEAVRKGNSIDLLPKEATEIARIICKLTGYDRATLSNTGTEAVLGAVRAARTATGRDRIAVFDTDYHGMIDQFMVRGINLKGKNKTLPGSPGIPKFMVENTLTLDYDDPEVIQKLENEIAELAAVVIEPVQAQNPHWQHGDLIKKIRELTEKHGVALVFDEIINGFRMHQKGAQGWYGVEADISAYGKSISGGLPIAAIAGKAKYMDAFDGGVWNYGDDSSPDGVIAYYASTFIKNPLSVAAGHAAIKEIERIGPALQADLNEKTIQFAERIREIFLRTKAPFMIQSASSFFMLKYVDGSPLNRLFNYYLRVHGINVRERPCFISTAHTEADFEKTYIGFERAIADMYDAGLIEPYDGEDLNVIVRPQEDSAHSKNELKTCLLTEGQQEIFLSNQLSENASRAYNISTEIRLEGAFDSERMKASLAELVRRHEALRTVIGADGIEQQVLPDMPVEVAFVDLGKSNAQLSQLHDEEVEHHFDLQNGPLFRFKVVKMEDEVHLVFITVHHIICDGWSLGILTRELGQLYGGRKPAQCKQISQFAEEQEQIRGSEVFEENEKYWISEFSDTVPVLELPGDFARPAVRTFSGSIEKITFDPTITARIRSVAAKNGSTFYVFMLAAYQAYLSRISGQNDLVVGIAAAGHNLPGNQNLVAHAIGMLPVRSQKEEGDSFSAYLKKVRNKVLNAFDHQQFTFGTLLKKIKIDRQANRNTLVNVAFNFDSPLNDLYFGELKAETRAIRRHFEIFDTFINLKPIGERVDFEWNFNTDLFKNETIKMRLEEFRTFLQDILEDAEKAITELRLLPDFESQLLAAFGKGEQANFPLHQCLHEHFEQQAMRTPNEVAAMMTTGEQITYRALNEKANTIAATLLQNGLQPNAFVGLCVQRGLDMLASIYGILKAGGAYVPIDPRNPKDRIQFILEDASCGFLLTQSDLKNGLPDFRGTVIEVDRAKSNGNTAPSFPKIQPQSPAYIIYTSGSTGQPKGVVVRHENALNTLFAINKHWQLKPGDVVYSVSSMSFDMSIPDYFLTLIMGGKLVIADEVIKKDGFALKESIEEIRPQVMQATPSTWNILMLSGWEGDSEMKAIAGGEGFPKGLASKMAKSCGEVWNGYGPTETTIYATYQKVAADNLQNFHGEFVPIGSPVANTEMAILDKDGKQVPVGVAGELYIGGKGVSNGYLNRSSLNAEKFVQMTGEVFYRTGDLVKYLPTGEIEFLGRMDDQVKIRGFRIEIGEIEETLKKHSSVRQAAVCTFKDNIGSDQLAAYVVLNQNADLHEVKDYLKDVLPGFMVPSIFMEMDAMPMNTSLKIDRNALPKPEIQSTKAQMEEPSTKGEEFLSNLWKDLLGVPNVSVQDDFFELGGHSLAAVKLMSKIKEETGKKLPLTTLFENSTIKKLAVQLNGYNTSLNGNGQKNGVQNSGFSSLICIRKGGNKAPLYLVHGGGLHVLFYQNLVKYMDKDQPIYALQAKGLNPGEEPLDRIEDMAAHYIREIKMQNPSGPYNLAGYSLGGLIAWEMAAQLKEENKEVPMLALFDAIAKYEWAGSGSTGNINKKFKKLGFNLSLLVKEPAKAIEYKSSVLKMQLQHMKGKLTMAYRNNDTNEIEEGYLPYGKDVYQKSLEAYEKYELKPLDIHVDLFKAKEQMFYLDDPVHYGWDRFALEGITLHEIEGNHLTLFDEPHGIEVANLMDSRLDDINRKNRTHNTASV